MHVFGCGVENDNGCGTNNVQFHSLTVVYCSLYGYLRWSGVNDGKIPTNEGIAIFLASQ